MKKLYIDIGGTYLRSELSSRGGVVIERETLSSQTTELMSYIDTKMRETPAITFIGISYAGQVHDGVILSAPNIALRESAIKAAAKTDYGVHLEIDNDLSCAVMAEADCFRTKNIAALYVGTGIGAAYIDGGKVVRGGRNLAFEIGHIPYKEAPFRCGCGRTNCVELFASGSALSKWLHHYGSEKSSDLEALKLSDIAEESSIAERFEAALLHAAGTLVTIANPDILVLGGGVIKHNPYLMELLKDGLKDVALAPSLETLRIEMTQLKNAPLEGVKLLEKRAYG
ncbi:MAG: ROK family protein [Campylobacterota bacterium]|nr:ROK family protein [Campylobacterota bacterium]